MKKIGLALGSGGARGWAHIGVIEALEEAGIPIDCVAGTSMGAVVGGTYVAGQLKALKDVALRLDWKQALYYFLEITFPRSGLIDGTKIVALLREHISKARIEDLPIPFATVAADIMSGKEVVLRKGDMVEAIRASASIPGMFTPVLRGGAVLADGGLLNPVPVDVARDLGAEFVIAVDLNCGAFDIKVKPAPPAPRKKRSPAKGIQGQILAMLDERLREFDASVLTPARKWILGEGVPNVFDVIGNSLRIMEAQVAEIRLKVDQPDILVRPAVGQFNFMEFHRAEEAIRAGYEATREQLKPWLREGRLPAGPGRRRFSNVWTSPPWRKMFR